MYIIIPQGDLWLSEWACEYLASSPQLLLLQKLQKAVDESSEYPSERLPIMCQ